MIPVYGHSHYHVRGGEHANHLQVFYGSAQKVSSSEPVRNFNGELRQDLEKRDHQVCEAQVQEKKLGLRISFTLLPKCTQEDNITTCCKHKNQTQNSSSNEGKTFVVHICCLSRAVPAGIHLETDPSNVQ